MSSMTSSTMSSMSNTVSSIASSTSSVVSSILSSMSHTVSSIVSSIMSSKKQPLGGHQQFPSLGRGSSATTSGYVGILT
jgi:phage-related protein